MPGWAHDDGWTQVQRRKGAQRSLRRERADRSADQPWEWDGGAPGGMARAPPAPFRRGRAQTRQSPNRPAPPSGAHFSGFQAESYAAVVRRNLPRQGPRFGRTQVRTFDREDFQPRGRTFWTSTLHQIGFFFLN